MDFNHLFFSARGRISRQPYWIGSIILGAIYLLVFFAEGFFGASGLSIVTLVLIWPSTMVGIKRCHDRGRSGWFVLLGAIPLVNIWLAIDLGFLRGTEGENPYGDNPLAEAR